MIRLPECPICGKSVAPVTDPGAKFAPFCSRRCKEVDLVRWCEGRYAIVEPVGRHRPDDSAPGDLEPDIDGYVEQGMHDDSESADD